MYGALRTLLTFWASATLLALSPMTICLANSDLPTPRPTKASQQPKGSGQQKNTNAYTDKRGTIETPLVVEVLPSEIHKINRGQNANEERDYSSSEWWLVYLTGVLAAFTFGLMIYTAKLWGATKHALRETKETAERQLRAYLSINIARITQQNRSEFRTITEIKNFGQTPAYNVRVWSILGAFDPSEPRNFIKAEAIETYSMLGPGGNFDLKAALRDQSPEQVQHIIGGTRQVYLWGEIRYHDAFMTERGFSFRIVADLSTSEPWGFRPTPDGNEEY